ncbi:unnamed protein product [Brassicogethes aeneus]|uniref:Prosaposin n=1 Tax=Brassicogethes aeneus TaxID=1431903 RepID=A0A9P0BAC4_BRAAE|nr:unnamed protein product [Brassicogethes aeneus]
MKILIFITFVAAFAISSGVFVPPRHHRANHLLGAKECTWGPSYWCQNITTSAHCRATKHCIELVWIHRQLPPDTSNVCQICKDMVTQARDNLLSNGTQELIKQVFEGSCALMHIKKVVKQCDNLVDEFVPELIDTLASQMNPQVVCSVAGLCNNERIHRMIAEAEQNGESDSAPVVKDTCAGCHSVVQLMESKFDQMSRDDVLQSFLHICGNLGSLSDACSNIVISYFTDIYKHIQESFNPTDVCLMAGECSAQFHQHDIEITIPSQSGYVKPNTEDDLPCDLCEQLVGHLRDLLVANTTESEFKMVLEGLCKQTRSFKSECLDVVDQYYGLMYTYLVNELKPKEMCSLINICPKSDYMLQPMSPLLPIETAEILKETPALPEKPLVHIKMPSGNTNVKILSPESAQLPIELLMPPHGQNLFSKESCVFCQYFLHFVQEDITNPKTEEQIKAVIDKACARLPGSINETCVAFVDSYEPALIAILAQEIDPSQVCPMIRACPSNDAQEDVEVFMQQQNESPKCPMCLYAVSKLESIVRDRKSKESIINGLTNLCTHLPKNMAPECEDFVQTYTNELVDMLMADFTPNEVCVYLHLCEDKPKPKSEQRPITVVDFDADFLKEGGDVRTNMIPDNTVNGNPVKDVGNKPQCALCEFVMREIDDQLKDNKTDDQIKKAVEKVCTIMPKSLRSQCKDFIDQNSDTIIALLSEALEPSEICAMLNFCDKKTFDVMRGEILECAICEGAVEAMKKILDNPRADHAVIHVMEKTCRAMPQKYREKCQQLIENFGSEILDNISHYTKEASKICQIMGKCSPELIGSNVCTRGPTYWCQNGETAEKCQATQHCETKVWNQSRAKRSPQGLPLLGLNPCTWGPSFFCDNLENAKRCHAVEYCQQKYWNKK